MVYVDTLKRAAKEFGPNSKEAIDELAVIDEVLQVVPHYTSLVFTMNTSGPALRYQDEEREGGPQAEHLTAQRLWAERCGQDYQGGPGRLLGVQSHSIHHTERRILCSCSLRAPGNFKFRKLMTISCEIFTNFP